MHSVPVRCDTHGGWGEMHGLLRFDGGRLVLQHQTRDAMLGVLKSRPSEAALSLDKLVEFRYRRFSWSTWTPAFELMFDDLLAASGLPGASGTTLTLTVRWRDRHLARRFADALQSVLAELRYQRLNEEIDRMTAARGAASGRAQAGASTGGASSSGASTPRSEYE